MFSLILLIVNSAIVSGFFLDSFNYPHGPGGPGGTFGGYSGNGCAPISSFCPVHCPSGYALDGHGCEICHCKNSDPSSLLTDGSHHHISNPCIPTHAQCTLSCEHYTKGPGGACEYCQCDYTHTSTRIPLTYTSTTTGTSSLTSTPIVSPSMPPSQSTTEDVCAIAAQLCDQKCSGEYLSDHKDCTYCVCKSDLG